LSTSSGANGTSRGAPDLPRQWAGAHTLRLVHELNERCIETLARLSTDRSTRTIEIVASSRALWSCLDAGARRRAAECPFLLVDVWFQNVHWWRSVKERRIPHVHSARHRCFPPRAAGTLMRETLMLTWSTARSDRRIAGLLLGLAPAVAEIIAGLGLQDVERIAAKFARQVRPRWEDRPGFWRSLVLAARDGDENTRHEIHLHGLQLLGADLLRDE